MPAKVELYATSFCRHCVAVREFLEDRQIEYDEYTLDLYPLEKNVMVERCGQKSVPQIFINNQHIGGAAELVELEKKNKLDKLLADY